MDLNSAPSLIPPLSVAILYFLSLFNFERSLTLSVIYERSYANSAQSFNQANSQVAEAYSQFANKLVGELNSVGDLGSEYTQKLGGLNKSLSALNSVYELQLDNMNKQVETSKECINGFGSMIDNMNQTVENTKKLNQGVQLLEQNVASLNNVYGNMLSSLNIK